MNTLAFLKRLRGDHVSLIAALDCDDAAAIEAAAEALNRTVYEARGQALWSEEPGAAALAREVCRMSEAARIRVNLLTDLNERRLQALAGLQGRTGAFHYGPDGRTAP
jgi:hypothetical protein